MEMIAADTNVVVRFLVDDHPAEAKRARMCFEKNRVYLAESVLLETEWVLRAAYGFSREAISAAIRAMLRLPSVSVDDRSAILRVMELFDEGFDFADAMHYVRSAGIELKTFDKKLINRGGKHGLLVSMP